MKSSVALFLLGILFVGCSGTKELPSFVSTVGYDFTEYTKKNFLITPEGYSSPYESIGILTVRLYPEVRKDLQLAFEPKIQANVKANSDKYDAIYVEGTVWYVEKTNSEVAIKEIYKRAVSMGADAVINFKVETETFSNGNLKYPIYVVSGFAIKRKQV